MSDTTRPKRYRMVSKFYKETYGEKVYKLPVALPLTCPIEMDQLVLEDVHSVGKSVLVMKIDLHG